MLNLIELIWSNLKRSIQRNNNRRNLSAIVIDFVQSKVERNLRPPDSFTGCILWQNKLIYLFILSWSKIRKANLNIHNEVQKPITRVERPNKNNPAPPFKTSSKFHKVVTSASCLSIKLYVRKLRRVFSVSLQNNKVFNLTLPGVLLGRNGPIKAR